MFRFLRLSRITLFVVSLACATWVSAADIVIGSWNVKRLGHGSKQDVQALATVASRFDILALQEVMTEEGLKKLVDALQAQTGESWSTLVSHAVGSVSYKEMYAFVWKDATVEYAEGATVYLDPMDQFVREPFSAKFQSKKDGTQFVIGTVHILYGKSLSDRTPEIAALAEYWEWLSEIYPDTALMLGGDFNLKPDHPSWAPLRRTARPLITQGATTLSAVDGRYANLYDNIWVEMRSQLPVSASGIIEFPRILDLNHEASRATVSDHAPVYVTLGAARLDTSMPGAAHRQRSTSFTVGSLRGNRASKIYHHPNCPSYNQVSEKNRVEFKSADEALAAGYRLARNC